MNPQEEPSPGRGDTQASLSLVNLEPDRPHVPLGRPGASRASALHPPKTGHPRQLPEEAQTNPKGERACQFAGRFTRAEGVRAQRDREAARDAGCGMRDAGDEADQTSKLNRILPILLHGFFFFFFSPTWPPPQHMEVPRPGIEPAPQEWQ